MNMHTDFKTQSGVIADKLADIASGKSWREDLRGAFQKQNYTDAQTNAMHAVATQTCFAPLSGYDEGNNIPPQLTHAFADPLGNSAMMLRLLGDDNKLTLNILVNVRSAIEDDIHNYPLLLGDDLPQSVRDVLESYDGEILPLMPTLIDTLSQETGINPADITPAKDWQHIHKLPEDIFTPE